MHSPELLKGTLQTIVLKLLKDHGKMYGYEITQRVKELSVGRILLTEGAPLPCPSQTGRLVHAMEVVNIGKQIRKYYILTSPGKAQAKERVEEFVDFIQTMGSVLQVKWS